MLQRFIEVMRGRTDDRAKARQHVARSAVAAYREAVRDYDRFVDVMRAVTGPAFPIGTARDSWGVPVPVRIPVEGLYVHWLVQGGTGTGKTSLVTSLVAWALLYGIRVGCIDCKSGFFQALIRWAGAIAYKLSRPERVAFIEHLAIIKPFSDALVPLNVCRVPAGSSAEVQSYEVTLALSRLFDAAFSTNMANIMRHLVQLLIAADLSLVEAPALLDDDLLRGVVVERFGTPALKEFFFRTYPILPDTSKHALSGRLQGLLLPESLRLMLGAERLIDFREIITRGDVMGAFFGKSLDAPEELVNVIGSLALQLIFQGAYASEGRHPPYLIVLDEFFHLLSAPTLVDRFAVALSSLRSFNTHLLLVMHNFSQVPPSLREALLTHCDRIILLRSSSHSIEYLGDLLPEVDPQLVTDALQRGQELPSRQETRRHLTERLQRLPTQHCFLYDRHQAYRSVLVRIADAKTPHEAAGLSVGELDAFIAEQRIDAGGYALPRETLRQQIAARQERLRQLLRPLITVHRPRPPSTTALPGARPKGRPRLG